MKSPSRIHHPLGWQVATHWTLFLLLVLEGMSVYSFVPSVPKVLVVNLQRLLHHIIIESWICSSSNFESLVAACRYCHI